MRSITGAPVAVDVFSGAGGLSEGLLSAGIHVAVAVEGHPHPALTHAFNHPDTSVICADICELPVDLIKRKLKSRTGRVRPDLVVGGPPCQGFSPAGKRDPNDARNDLAFQFIRLLEELNPRMFLFENVPAFCSFDDGRRIDELLQRFWSLGYEVFGVPQSQSTDERDFPIANSANFGAPQRRERLILVGYKPHRLSQPFKWPRKRNFLRLGGMDGQTERPPFVSVEDAIGDLAFLSSGLEATGYDLPSDSRYQRDRRLHSDRLFNHLATKHRKSTVDMFRRIGAGQTINSVDAEKRSGKQRMRRLAKDQASFAILALPDDYLHYKRHRIPTVREMARLQSFDDSYVFFGKRTTSDLNRRVDVPQYTQVGNAVPPLMARAFGLSIVRSLGGEVRDLRDHRKRRDRHKWVVGSSSFAGYELLLDAETRIDLTDANGKFLTLPTAEINTQPLVGTFRWSKSAAHSCRKIG